VVFGEAFFGDGEFDDGVGGLAGGFEEAGFVGGGGVAVVGGDGGGGIAERAHGSRGELAGDEVGSRAEEVGEGGHGFGEGFGGSDVGELAQGDADAKGEVGEIDLVGVEEGDEDFVGDGFGRWSGVGRHGDSRKKMKH